MATEKVVVKDLLIVGMGDSFASGEGNPDVPVRFSRDRSADYGTRSADRDLTGYPARIGPWKQIGDKSFIQENARWTDQGCHRSLYSHQLRAALQLGLEDDHRAVTYVGVACSGSEVTFGLFLQYAGNEWVPNPTDKSQISAIASAQCDEHEAPMQDLPEAYHMDGTIPELKGGLVLRKCDPINARKIDLMFVSVGGNDVGFSRLLANSVLADESTLRKLGGWFGQVHSLDDASLGLEALILRYKSLNRAIHYLLHIPWEQSDRVLLTAYPGLALQGDGTSICPDGVAGMDVLPDFALSEQKARIGTWIADKLNTAMSEAAAHYQWTFVDSHRRDFAGRGLCAGTTYDGANIADDLRLPRKIGGGLAALQPGRLQGVCLTPTLVPHAQRRVHDRQLPRRHVAAAEGAEARHLRLVPARARCDVLGRLPSDRRRAGGHRRRRRAQGARRAGQVRAGAGTTAAGGGLGAADRRGRPAIAAIRPPAA